jgi:hypothetical protein
MPQTKSQIQKKCDLQPKRRFRVVKRLAAKKHMPCTITLTQYTNLLSKPCYYCGRSLFGEYGVGLDRIDNSHEIGYRINNVLPCCSECNKGKNEFFTVEEFKIMIQALLKYRKSKEL